MVGFSSCKPADALVPFLIHFVYFLLLSIPSLSTRIVPLCFQAEGHRKRPNLGLVFCVYFVLSVFLSYDACLFFVVFGLVLKGTEMVQVEENSSVFSLIRMR